MKQRSAVEVTVLMAAHDAVWAIEAACDGRVVPVTLRGGHLVEGKVRRAESDETDPTLIRAYISWVP